MFKFILFLVLVCGTLFDSHSLPDKNLTVIFQNRPKRSTSYCSYSQPRSRKDCGWNGITESACESRNCCFDSKYSNYNNCFIRTGGTYTDLSICTTIKPDLRRECGFWGITERQCEARDCCYDDRVTGQYTPHCFYSSERRTTTTTPIPTSTTIQHSDDPRQRQLHVGYAESGTDVGNRDFADAAFAHWDTPDGKGDLFYAKADSTGRTGASVGIGFINHRAGNGVGVSHKILTAELDAHNGLMGRAALADGTIHAGPVDINLGVVADTGIKFEVGGGPGMEVKVLGIGGKIGAKGIEACYIVCIGIGW